MAGYGLLFVEPLRALVDPHGNHAGIPPAFGHQVGMGVAFVPIRALALYAGKSGVRRIALPQRFSRELVVVMRQQRNMPAHLAGFVDNVLF